MTRHWRNWVFGLACWMMWSASAHAERPTDLYTIQNKTTTVSAITTDGVLWTPASGFRAVVMGCAVSSGGAQQTLLEINNAAILPNIYTAADTNYVLQPTGFPIAAGATDQTVTYTTTSNTTTTITCVGYEFQG